MRKVLIDTNIILQFIAVGDQRQLAAAAQLFERARNNELRLVIHPPVLFEVAWVMKRTLKLDRDEILNFLASLAQTPGVSLSDAKLVNQALTYMREHGRDFADSYIAAAAVHSFMELASFDQKHFGGLPVKMYKP